MSDLTPLELAVLEVFHDEYSSLGFPLPDAITVSARSNTGVGRFVTLVTDARLNLENGYLDMGGHFIEMSGVSNGLMAMVSIVNSSLEQLEIAVYGDESWDGSESRWQIV